MSDLSCTIRGVFYRHVYMVDYSDESITLVYALVDDEKLLIEAKPDEIVFSRDLKKKQRVISKVDLINKSREPFIEKQRQGRRLVDVYTYDYYCKKGDELTVVYPENPGPWCKSVAVINNTNKKTFSIDWYSIEVPLEDIEFTL